MLSSDGLRPVETAWTLPAEDFRGTVTTQQGRWVPLKYPFTFIPLPSKEGFSSTFIFCPYKKLSCFWKGSSTNPK